MSVKTGLSRYGKNIILMVFENRVLRRIFGPKREEVAGGWRRLHNEELRNSYALPNIIITVIKSRRMKWAGSVICLGEKCILFWSENLNGRDHSENLGIDSKIILERILQKYGEKVWNGCIWLGVETSNG